MFLSAPWIGLNLHKQRLHNISKPSLSFLTNTVTSRHYSAARAGVGGVDYVTIIEKTGSDKGYLSEKITLYLKSFRNLTRHFTFKEPPFH
jgi:hypothetical protein